jgi:hypothetical protein
MNLKIYAQILWQLLLLFVGALELQSQTQCILGCVEEPQLELFTVFEGECSLMVEAYVLIDTDECSTAQTVIISIENPDGTTTTVTAEDEGFGRYKYTHDYQVGNSPYTITATENSTNHVSTCSGIYVVLDEQPPVIAACAQDRTLPLNTAGQIELPDFREELEIEDNCTYGLEVVQTPAPGTLLNLIHLDTVTVSFVVTDAGGNEAECEMLVTACQLVVSCPDDITVGCSESTLPSDTGLPIILSTCGEWSIDIEDNTDESTGCIAALDNIIRTFTITDDQEFVVVCTQTISRTDNVAPSITVQAQDETVACGSNNEAAFAAWLSSNGGAVASDACSAVVWSTIPANPVLSDLCGNTGAATVTFVATDACGNSSQTTATFTIEDTTDPAIDTPAANLTVECDGSGNTAALNAWLSNHGGAIATDACGSVNWSNDYDVDNFIGECGATGSVTVLFTATDDCGNSSETTATFTIEDTTNPTIDTPAANLTVECDGSGNTAALNAWLSNHGGAIATDACGSVNWSNDYDADNYVGECGATGSVTVVFTATDECGNSSETTATFTVEDTTNPAIDTPASNLTVECDGSGNETELAAWLANHGGALATDACGSVNWSNDYDADNFIGGCGATGSVTVVFTATDECGNSSETTATFTVEDTTPRMLAGRTAARPQLPSRWRTTLHR